LSEFLITLGFRLGFGFAFAASAIFLLTALELVTPKGAILPIRDRMRLIGRVAIFTTATVIVSTLANSATSYLAVSPLIPALGIGDALIAVLLGDFLYYWYHRAQHSVPWLWRIHSVHHAQPLGAGAGYHHLLEAPLKALLVAIPGSLLFGGGIGLTAYIFLTLHGYYVHSTTRLHFGPFAWLLCDNRVHRIHHSTDPEHFDRNFGVVTLAWDRLFGTARMPKNEWPEVGLADRGAPIKFAEMLTL
jgi:sterol desaturase/sphingolipid hydroxylase (fatty acid hydroxylase superfamily)